MDRITLNNGIEMPLLGFGVFQITDQKEWHFPGRDLLRRPWRIFRQEQIIAIPKSVHEERIHQNYEIDDFELSTQDIEKINRMDTGESLILDAPSLDEVYRLQQIRFEQ